MRVPTLVLAAEYVWFDITSRRTLNMDSGYTLDAQTGF